MEANLCSCSNCDATDKHHHRKKKLHISHALYNELWKQEMSQQGNTLGCLI
jgi:hypothetical protein